ncbi:MAG TPA: methyltransferase domain-containing protein [Candidatus Paceibacterota bacterium]
MNKFPQDTHIGKRARRIRPFLVCPVCYGDLSDIGSTLVCGAKHTFGRTEEGVPLLMLDELIVKHADEHLSGVNRLKSFLKKYPKFYYYVVWGLFCPVLMWENPPTKLLKYLKTDPLVADIGSGPQRVHDSFINLDIYPFPGVDVVGTGHFIPIKDGTFDGVINETVIEHISDERAFVSEMTRIVKPGGVVYTSAPFIHPFHGSPDDFHRFTTSALKELFKKDYEILEVGIRSGPWSAFLMFLCYWFGNIITLGNRRLAPFAAHIFMLVLGPFKIFDPLFTWMPNADAVSAVLYIIARKQKNEA